MLLKWRDVWDSDTTFKKTVDWYKNYYEKDKILTEEDLNSYIADAREKGVEWVGGNAE
jgi:CDP-glucose 4,6-dehydratase